jgi:hypothetical protein
MVVHGSMERSINETLHFLFGAAFAGVSQAARKRGEAKAQRRTAPRALYQRWAGNRQQEAA